MRLFRKDTYRPIELTLPNDLEDMKALRAYFLKRSHPGGPDFSNYIAALNQKIARLEQSPAQTEPEPEAESRSSAASIRERIRQHRLDWQQALQDQASQAKEEVFRKASIRRRMLGDQLSWTADRFFTAPESWRPLMSPQEAVEVFQAEYDYQCDQWRNATRALQERLAALSDNTEEKNVITQQIRFNERMLRKLAWRKGTITLNKRTLLYLEPQASVATISAQTTPENIVEFVSIVQTMTHQIQALRYEGPDAADIRLSLTEPEEATEEEPVIESAIDTRPLSQLTTRIAGAFRRIGSFRPSMTVES